MLVEEHINGKPDIMVIKNDKKIAVEIETGNSDFLQNIEKDLKAGFNEVICVATNKQTEENIKEQLKDKNLKRVTITSAFAFDI